MGRRETPGADPRAARYLGIALLAPALPMWGLVPVTPLAAALRPAARGRRGGSLGLGRRSREVIRRYRAYLDPGRHFRRGDR